MSLRPAGSNLHFTEGSVANRRLLPGTDRQGRCRRELRPPRNGIHFVEGEGIYIFTNPYSKINKKSYDRFYMMIKIFY